MSSPIPSVGAVTGKLSPAFIVATVLIVAAMFILYNKSSKVRKALGAA